MSGAEGREYPRKPGALRGLVTVAAVASVIYLLAARGESGTDEFVMKLGKIEVTARLVDAPEQFPNLGAYRYTYVIKYKVLAVHRQDSRGKYRLSPGDEIFVGHYKPWMPRSEIKDENCDGPVGGKLTRFVIGEAHRMALDYELGDAAPAGVLDFCFPQDVNRFFAVWTNPTAY